MPLRITHSEKSRSALPGGLHRRALPVLMPVAFLASVSVVQAHVPPAGNWSILFDDEFNGNSLDTMKWNYNYPWSQHGLADDSVEQQSQVTVGNGAMTLTAIASGQWYNNNWYDYTSGAVNTNGKLNFTYGYIEASQEMPGNQGAWPAFWTLQNGWPPEIDIQEDPEFQWNESSYPVTYHYTPAGGGSAASAGTTVNTGINLAGSYNIYGVDWEPNSLTYYFNGNAVYTVTSSQANIAQLAWNYLLIDLGVGGWPGNPPAGTYYPATMETDWVRVWQQNGASQTGWNSASSGSWDTSGNWNNGVPALTATTAYFGAQSGSPSSITVDWSGSRSINGLIFDASTKYLIGASANDGAGIMISSADGVPTTAESVTISQTAKAVNGNTINARVEIPYSLLTLNVTNSASAPLTFAGNIIGPGNITFGSGPSTISGSDQATGVTTVTGLAKLTVSGQITSTADLLIAQGTVTINSGASVASTGYSSVGSVGAGTGVLALSGSMSTTGDFNVGDVTGSIGSMTLVSGSSLGAETFYVGKFGNAHGTVSQNGGAVTTLGGGGDWRIGGGSGTGDSAAVGIYNISGGTFTDTNNFQVGAYGTGTLTQSGGAVVVGSWLSIGRFAGGTGIYNLTGGSLTATGVPYLIVGEQGTGTLLLSGGAIVNAKALSLAHSDGTNATGTVLQTGGTMNAPGGVVFGESASGSAVATGTYNLAGGTLETGSIARNSLATVSGTLLLNGGTIQPTASSTSFMTGLTSVRIEQQGAVFNTSGFNITVNQILTHDSALGSTADGGLTKSGAGTLTIGSAETYTGPTNISGGTLQLGTGANLLPTTTAVDIMTGGTALNLNTSNQTLGSLAGVSGSIVSVSGAVLTFGNTKAAEFDGSIIGTGTILKQGIAPFTLGGISSFTGIATVSAGTITLKSGSSFTASSILINNGAQLNVTGVLPGSPAITDLGTLTLNYPVSSGIAVRQLGNLTIGNSAYPTISAIVPAVAIHTNRSLIVASGLTLAGTTGSWTSRFDLANNDLDVQNGNLAILTNQVEQGYASGTWAGAGLTSSSAQGDTTHLTALGVIQNSTNGSPSGLPLYTSGPGLGLFDTISPPATDVLMKYTYYGDANLDGTVDGSDYGRIDSGFQTNSTGWYNGDFNYDGVVDGSDYTLIDNTFNMQGAALTEQIAGPASQTASEIATPAAVPEPAMLTPLALGLSSLLRRRRRKPPLVKHAPTVCL